MITKKIVETHAFIEKNHGVVLKGRLLGWLTPLEYAGLVDKPELRKKLFTVESKDLSDVIETKQIEGLRMAMTVNRKDDVVVAKPTLFITEPMEMITSILENGDSINLNGQEGTFFMVSEEEE